MAFVCKISNWNYFEIILGEFFYFLMHPAFNPNSKFFLLSTVNRKCLFVLQMMARSLGAEENRFWLMHYLAHFKFDLIVFFPLSSSAFGVKPSREKWKKSLVPELNCNYSFKFFLNVSANNSDWLTFLLENINPSLI